MKNKIMYALFGFVLGFSFSNIFSIPELMAQYATWTRDSGFQESNVEPSVPKSYGELQAVYGIEMYFQSEDGTIYIVEPRSPGKLKTEVKVIHRS